MASAAVGAAQDRGMPASSENDVTNATTCGTNEYLRLSMMISCCVRYVSQLFRGGDCIQQLNVAHRGFEIASDF